MKLDSYRMLCAMKAGDHIAAGRIMSEHFRVPEIEHLTATLDPHFGGLGPKDNLEYMVCVIYKNTSYHWFNTIGFAGPDSPVSTNRHYQAFDIWIRA